MGGVYRAGRGQIRHELSDPAYPHTAYNLTANDAALRTAGFVVLAMAARPVGGWLFRPAAPGTGAGLVVLGRGAAGRRPGLPAPLMPSATITFLGVAALLGAVSGAVFALVGKVARPTRSGRSPAWSAPPAGLGGFLPR